MSWPAVAPANQPFRGANHAPGPLDGYHYDFGWETDLASHYAARLLTSLGANVTPPRGRPALQDAARDWARSGLLPPIGHADGPPLPGPAALATCANGVLRALRAVAGRSFLPGIEGAGLLGERAACLGLQRLGQTSANGSCRLLRTADDWLALNLARTSDWELLPAWLEADLPQRDWNAVAEAVRDRPVAHLVARGRLLGLPLAPASGTPMPPGWFHIHQHGPQATERARDAAPLVVDLSSLWAGPLCSHLLQQAGARVIKVESLQRPDGARGGNCTFFDLLHAGKASVALDFGSPTGRDQLRRLLRRADIVIEGSRPRALAQFGIDAEALVAEHPGRVWISITGYGRIEPAAHWVAFGDDAAVAAGVARAASDHPPLFCGDALADPLTGLHAALAGLAWWRSGRGALLDLSLCQVTSHCLRALPASDATVVRAGGGWMMESAGHRWLVSEPRRRALRGSAPALGADTPRILEEFELPC